MLYADILFPRKISQDKETLTYQIPESLKLLPGQAVRAPLRNNITSGLVLAVHKEKPKFKTLPIQEILYEKPLLSTNQLELFNWLSKYYFCPLHKILKLFIPKRILAGKPQPKNHATDNQITKIPAKDLTAAQKRTINEITTQKTNKFLIHGITGSGKTEIYTQLAQDYLNQGKQILILVPEISLTPQMIDYFEKAIGVKSAVIHSKISEGERQAAWMSIWAGKSQL
ncbi:MAG: DEAD/DEAH box helicase family protein, partial [Patescibacteria group bacterium]